LKIAGSTFWPKKNILLFNLSHHDEETPTKELVGKNGKED